MVSAATKPLEFSGSPGGHHVGRRHAHVIEEEFGLGHAAPAHLAVRLADFEARHPFSHHQRADAEHVLTAGALGQEALLLIFGAENLDHPRRPVDGQLADQRGVEADARDFFQEHRGVQDGQTRTTVLLGDDQAEVAEFRQQIAVFLRELFLCVPVRRLFGKGIGGELAKRGAKLVEFACGNGCGIHI